jgi:hypothetical protein
MYTRRYPNDSRSSRKLYWHPRRVFRDANAAEPSNTKFGEGACDKLLETFDPSCLEEGSAPTNRRLGIFGPCSMKPTRHHKFQQCYTVVNLFLFGLMLLCQVKVNQICYSLRTWCRQSVTKDKSTNLTEFFPSPVNTLLGCTSLKTANCHFNKRSTHSKRRTYGRSRSYEVLSVSVSTDTQGDTQFSKKCYIKTMP